MFHANAGLPFAAVMNGSSLVLPGPNLQPEKVLDLLSKNRVTLTRAVPTVCPASSMRWRKSRPMATRRKPADRRRRFTPARNAFGVSTSSE